MAQVIHLSKGRRAPTEPGTVVINVQSRGGGSISDVKPNGQTVLKVVRVDADGMIKSVSAIEGVRTVYVIGYDQAKDHAVNLDHLREYASRLIDR